MPLFKKNKLFSRSKIIFIISLILLMFFIVNLIKEIINRHQIDRQIADLESQIKQLERENLEIDSLITSWSGSSQLEKEARLKLGLQKPGEQAVLILREETSVNQEEPLIDPDSEIIGNVIVSGQSGKEIPNPIKWWQHFFY